MIRSSTEYFAVVNALQTRPDGWHSVNVGGATIQMRLYNGQLWQASAQAGAPPFLVDRFAIEAAEQAPAFLLPPIASPRPPAVPGAPVYRPSAVPPYGGGPAVNEGSWRYQAALGQRILTGNPALGTLVHLGIMHRSVGQEGISAALLSVQQQTIEAVFALKPVHVIIESRVSKSTFDRRRGHVFEPEIEEVFAGWEVGAPLNERQAMYLAGHPEMPAAVYVWKHRRNQTITFHAGESASVRRAARDAVERDGGVNPMNAGATLLAPDRSTRHAYARVQREMAARERATPVVFLGGAIHQLERGWPAGEQPAFYFNNLSDLSDAALTYMRNNAYP